MPQKIKYVGPKDDKNFRGFHFIRDVSDDASGGENAVEVPDDIANAALKDRTSFLQWNRKVPDDVKALRAKLPDALEAEGRKHVEHFARRLAIADALTTDSPKEEARRAFEMKGAQAQVDAGMAKIREAQELRERCHVERRGGRSASVPVSPAALAAAGAQGFDLSALLVQLQQALADSNAVNAELRAEMADLRRQMQDGIQAEDHPADGPEVEGDGEGDEGGEPSEASVELEDLGLSSTVRAALEEAGVTTVADLVALSREQLGDLKGMGPKRVAEVEEMLAAAGKALASPQP